MTVIVGLIHDLELLAVHIHVAASLQSLVDLVSNGAGVSVLEVEPARDPSGAAIPLRYKVLRIVPPKEWQD